MCKGITFKQDLERYNYEKTIYKYNEPSLNLLDATIKATEKGLKEIKKSSKIGARNKKKFEKNVMENIKKFGKYKKCKKINTVKGKEGCDLVVDEGRKKHFIPIATMLNRSKLNEEITRIRMQLKHHKDIYKVTLLCLDTNGGGYETPIEKQVSLRKKSIKRFRQEEAFIDLVTSEKSNGIDIDLVIFPLESEYYEQRILGV